MPKSTVVQKSEKLTGVCYDIRGVVLETAIAMEAEGNQILKLNIGNPAPFGFNAPEELLMDLRSNLTNAQGYTDSRGAYSARKAVMQDIQCKGVKDVSIDDVFLGNGVSELILMSMQALLNTRDEMLVPSPDYPLWTASIKLCGGKAVHYICDEKSNWEPDIEDIKSKINDRTRGIVLINPNNPTGAVYSRETLIAIAKLASENHLLVFSDEIYSKILYDNNIFFPMARICQQVDNDIICLSFDGLSKNYRAAGFRSGWMTLSGNQQRAKSYIEGLNMLASMRLCANVPAMFVVQGALGGYQSINDLTAPEGRLNIQRNIAYDAISNIPGLSTTKPAGAFYLFPKIDSKRFSIHSDEKFVLDFLVKHKVLLVPGSAFNCQDENHFRIVFLPRQDELSSAINSLGEFLEKYQQK
jgi:alanine-synthesizing transaminase